MNIHYDLHIHSCLSPCGDPDMTPNNIVNMAMLADLEMIAVTDHNSCKNLPAVFEIAQLVGITPVAGMELTTAEECHVLCFFPALDNAMAFDKMLEGRLFPIKNKAEVYGNQNIMNAKDEIIGDFPILLNNATPISIEDIMEELKPFDGLAIPAHVNRPSNSVMAMLSYVPPGFPAYEVSVMGDAESYHEFLKSHQALEGAKILNNSDAHFLHLIQEAGPVIDLESNTAEAFFQWLKN